MTNEKAIKEMLKFQRCHYEKPNGDADLDVYEALTMAVRALEKQTPATPVWHVLSKYKNGNVKKGAWKCPTCLRIEYVQRRDALDTHCGFCGQAIEWEGVE